VLAESESAEFRSAVTSKRSAITGAPVTRHPEMIQLSYYYLGHPIFHKTHLHICICYKFKYLRLSTQKKLKDNNIHKISKVHEQW